VVVFAPCGFLFLLAPARRAPACETLLTLSGLGVFGTAIGGLALGAFLLRASRGLVERDRQSLARAPSIAAWSSLHHALVLVSFALFALHENDARFALLAAAPCAIGWAHAWALSHASRWARRVELPACG
jgi:hypothetical protein